MTLSIGASQSGTGADGGTTVGVTTQATNSSFVVGVVVGNGNTNAPTVGPDNKGNAYTLIGAAVKGATANVGTDFWLWVYKCENGLGGSGHTVPISVSSASHPHSDGSYYFAEIKSTGGYPVLDTTATGSDGATPYTTGNLTTSGANELLISFIGSAANDGTISQVAGNGLVKQQEVTDANDWWTGAVAAGAAATAGIYSGSWTEASGSALDTALMLLAFEEHVSSGSATGAAAAKVSAVLAAGVASATAVAVGAGSLGAPIAAGVASGSGPTGSSAASAATLAPAIASALASATTKAVGAAVVAGPAAAGTAQSGSSSGVPTLGTHTMLVQPDSQGSSPATTSAINTQTSGSAFFCMLGGFAYTHTPTDTFGNTYTQQGTIQNWNNQFPNEALKAFVAYGTGGTGHQLSLVKDASWATRELSMPFIEIKNAVSCTQVQHYVASGSTNVCAPVTVTGPALLIAIWSGDSAANGLTMTAVPDSGFTVIESFLVIPNASGCQMAVAVLQVASAGSYGLTWTETPTQGAEVAIFAFEGGVVTSTGVGAATASPASATGAGSSGNASGSAAAIAHAALAAGAGFNTSTGIGSAAAGADIANGTGTATTVGSGAATASPDTAAGSGGSGSTAGTGSATAGAAIAQVAASVTCTGAGAVNVSSAIASALSSATSVGVGSAQASPAIAQGFAGLSPSIGSGAAIASPAIAAGIAQAITRGTAAVIVSPAAGQGQASAFSIGAVAVVVSAAIGAGVGGSGSTGTVGAGAVTVASAIATGNGTNTSVGNVLAFANSAIGRGFAGRPMITEPSRIVLLPAENRTLALPAEPRIVAVKE